MTIGRALGRSVVTSAALGAIPDPVLEAYGHGAHAVGQAIAVARGARWFAAGSTHLRSSSGRSGSARTVVAGEFLHGPGDRAAAIGSLSADFAALKRDILTSARNPEDAAWALASVVPQIAAWQGFVDNEKSSMLAPYLTDWSAFVTWQEKLVRLRELAAARGIALTSADPIPLPMTVWERTENGRGSGADRWLTLAKWTVYAALGLMGALSLYAALRAVRREVTS